MTPRYRQYWNKCIFLGRSGKCDLYYCYDLGFPSIVVRFGNDQNNYFRGYVADQGYFADFFDEARRRISRLFNLPTH